VAALTCRAAAWPDLVAIVHAQLASQLEASFEGSGRSLGQLLSSHHRDSLAREDAERLAALRIADGLRCAARDRYLEEHRAVLDMLVAVGNRAGLGTDILYLSSSEIVLLAQDGWLEPARTTASHRRQAWEALGSVAFPTELGLAELHSLGRPVETGTTDPAAPPHDAGARVLEGQRVSGGAGVTRGVARVSTGQTALTPASDDEILVSRRVDIDEVMGWRGGRAVILERGSVLSHAAIVARELGLTLIVGAKHATTRIQDGDTLEIDEHGRVTIRG